ncbi:LysR family transcriptional regulator [Rubinisphaera margarita]|uniref:LysR family transcriptional regulator n=1 Tax=Rubinisphaera margarita TaxID=2909586 RepID=UPI001EE8C431|nr:LysR family transcriptional regulator [Rubinisphaera margarita]MCG6155418.1 LysR family transcriptional regulator [Rubinisphaera margarita]
MHLRNVEMFCDAVELRSFSRAAEHQKVSQSAVSQAIQQLEKRLGMQLIDRSKRPFELTTAGSIYFEGCRDLLHSFREVEDRVREMENRVVGRIRVVAIYSVGLIQINETIERFQREYPEVEVSIDFVHPDEVYRRVGQEQDDLGLVSFPKSKGLFECVHWQDQPMVIVVGRNHAWFDRETVTARELDGVRFVGFKPNLFIRKAIDRWFREVGVGVETVHEFDNIEYVKRDVESGTGVALLPEPTVRDECLRGRMKALQVEGTSWVRPLGMIHRKGRELSLATRKFVDVLLSESCTELSSSPG